MPLPAALMAAGPIAGLLGRIFGGAGKGAADQRISENDQRMRAGQIDLSRAGLQSQHNLAGANLDLNRKQFQQNEPNAQAGQAVRGSMLQRLQPLQMSGLSPRVQQSMPQMTSMLDALGPEAREAGGLLAQRGLSGLQGGPTQFAPVPQLNLPPAMMAQLKQPGMLEKILGVGGLIGSTVGALGDLNSVGGDGKKYDPSDENGYG